MNKFLKRFLIKIISSFDLAKNATSTYKNLMAFQSKLNKATKSLILKVLVVGKI